MNQGAPCACGCGKLANPGRRFLKAHGARKVPAGNLPPSHEKEYRSKYMKKYRTEGDIEKQRKSKERCRLWAYFRITPEEQAAIEQFQREHPIFNILLGNNGTRLGTDHNHKTGLIRGRLHWRVNQAYGMIEQAFPHNTAAVLRALADFHDNPPAIAALGGPRYGLLGKAEYKKKMVYGPPAPQTQA